MKCNYKYEATSILQNIRDKANLKYFDFVKINEAIDLFEKEYSEENDFPYFQITVSKGNDHYFYLAFSEEGFKFSEYLRDGDYSHFPNEILSRYDGVEVEGNEGSIENWENGIYQMLNEYGDNCGDENKIEINFDEDY